MQSHELLVDIPRQSLYYFKGGELAKKYIVSTAKNGAGEGYGSEQTPRGWHKIRAKIGANAPINTIFVARRPTGECYTPELGSRYPGRDWILTRILWLSGLEIGKNRFGHCDTMKRYIYIHGCPDSKQMGIPGSKGCINMANQDLIELFDVVPVGTKVYIRD